MLFSFKKIIGSYGSGVKLYDGETEDEEEFDFKDQTFFDDWGIYHSAYAPCNARNTKDEKKRVNSSKKE